MALGAQRRDILRLVVGHGLRLVIVGLVVGLAAAFAISRLLANMLFGISATDPTTFGVVPLILGTMAVLASYIPAVRATRLDPSIALRNE
jgi:putative ABC transport system permease protein